MKFTRRILSSKDQRGIAIVMAVFCLALVSYIVTEVSYETEIEYNIHSQSISRLKAYYAARSALELSLLRIKLYRKIQTQFGSQLGSNSGMLNMIWSFPLGWPPTLPDESTMVDKDMIKDKVKEAKMDSTYTASIFDEGSKIDINDLDSPSKALREITKKQLLKIFENKMLTDQDWAKNHADFRGEELVNNIVDWVDADKTSLNGGDERAQYRDTKQETWPPNRAFRTVEEMRLVAGMTDEIFQLLSSRVTVYGAKAINPNTANRDVLQSLDASMTDEVITEVLKRRDNPQAGGFYTSKDDFWNFVNSKGGRVEKSVTDDTPLIFDAVTNFRIQAIGEFHGAIRQIDAIVFDISSAATSIADRMKKETPATDPNDPNKPKPPDPALGPDGKPKPNTAKPNQTISKGPPRIVYWYEK